MSHFTGCHPVSVQVAAEMISKGSGPEMFDCCWTSLAAGPCGPDGLLVTKSDRFNTEELSWDADAMAYWLPVLD